MMTQTRLNTNSPPSAEREGDARGSGARALLGSTETLAAAHDDLSGRPGASWRVVYSIVERNSRKHWLRVGIAFVNRDGSLNVRLDAVPISGQLHIRESRDEPPSRAVESA